MQRTLTQLLTEAMTELELLQRDLERLPAPARQRRLEAIRQRVGSARQLLLRQGNGAAGDSVVPSRHEGLSARERQVLRLFGAGRTTKEIGYDLRLSAKTVSTYRSRILHKLDLDSTAELVRYAVTHG